MKKILTKKLILFLVLLVLSAVFVVYYNFFRSSDSTSLKPQDQITKVTAIKIKSDSRFKIEELPARVSAIRTAQIRPQIDGVITKIMFKEGSFVSKGQNLYEIDPVEKVTIKSPISGYISRSYFTEGSLVTKNQDSPLATISQIDPIYVDIALPVSKLAEIKDNPDVEVVVFIGDKEYENKGVLKLSENIVDPSTDSVTLRAQFSNKDQKLLSGMFVTANIRTKNNNIITVPQRVVDRLPNLDMFVFVIDENNVVKQQVIKADKIIDNDWIVEEGLKEGDLLVYEGLQKVKPDSKVEVVEVR